MGLQKILSLLESVDADVRVHAVKVVANLAAEGMIMHFRQSFLVLIFLSKIVYFEYSDIRCVQGSKLLFKGKEAKLFCIVSGRLQLVAAFLLILKNFIHEAALLL